MGGFLIVLFVLFSLGCKQSPKNFEFFMLHPEQIQPALAECNLNKVQHLPVNRECAAVLEAIPVIDQYLTELSMGSRFFGLRIMQAQLRLMELKQQLTKEQNQELQTAIDKQNLIIQSRYAIIRFIRERR